VSRRFLLSILTITVVVLGATVVASRTLGTDEVEAAASETSTPTTAIPTTVAPTTTPPTTVAPTTTAPPVDALPADSGAGRRVVFSVSAQRTWWVDEAGTVLRTALVSGRPNTPATGTFQVYSRTEHATGLDGSKMDYFVRFTKGPNGWAIGFHDIPEEDGVPVQTEAQLGEPLSHGCIRQAQADALFTWDFLQVGDTVVVVA
jgi:lipoprotein-anchoring transpeptidase ErfK/SrfK